MLKTQKTYTSNLIAKCIVSSLPFTLLVACSNLPTSQHDSLQTKASNTLLIYGGPILTMEGMQPTYVEALLIQAGHIEFSGKLEQARKMAPQAQHLNLEQRTVIPGIIDAHSHVNSVGLQQTVANLYSPPDGTVTDINSLIVAMKNWQQKNPEFIQATSGWIMGNGYDDAQLKEKRHPTATELDQISKDQPVLILHQSGHLASVNHKALEILNINAKTPNPSGGVIRRINNSMEPNGVLEESVVFSAMMQAFKTVPPDMMQKMALTAIQTYI